MNHLQESSDLDSSGSAVDMATYKFDDEDDDDSPMKNKENQPGWADDVIFPSKACEICIASGGHEIKKFRYLLSDFIIQLRVIAQPINRVGLHKLIGEALYAELHTNRFERLILSHSAQEHGLSLDQIRFDNETSHGKNADDGAKGNYPRFPKECQVSTLSLYMKINEIQKFLIVLSNRLAAQLNPNNKKIVQELISEVTFIQFHTAKVKGRIERYSHDEHGIPFTGPLFDESYLVQIIADAMRDIE